MGQNLITGQLGEVVVDPFEKVQIAHHDAERLIVSQCLLMLSLFIEMPTVVQTGQWAPDAQLKQLLMGMSQLPIHLVEGFLQVSNLIP